MGPTDIYIKAICNDYTYSELYEITALCNVLKWNIRSLCPNIDARADISFVNNIFTPTPPINANGEITILWSHALNEKEARERNNGSWRPNHFVPLLSITMHNASEESAQSASLLTVS